MRSRRWMVVVWASFLVRLLFYSAMLPLWEGYDEWAHFAVLRQMAEGGRLLVARDAPVSRDVEASFGLVPVPWEMRSLPPPSYTQDDYWRLSAEERARREAELRTMPSAWSAADGAGRFAAYESLQPPLYYWLLAPPLWVCGKLGMGLAGEVLALRFLSSLLASLLVPLVFFLGREVCGSESAAVGGAAVAALMPGLAYDVARVGNDCLAVVLFTLLTWLAVRVVRHGLSFRLALATGCVAGLGLLSKAYFLAAIPPLAAIWGYAAWKSRRAVRAGAAAGLAALLAGWWYVHNLLTTGTLAGLSESVMLRGMGAGEMLRRAAGIHWARAIDAILFSHLYFGGWSSLTVRSWMYHVFYCLIAAAALGLARSVRRPEVLALLGIYFVFWLAQLYNVLLLSISKGLGGSMGWYLYAAVGAEVILCIVGLDGLVPRRMAGWSAAAGAALFALLDLYTLHAVAIPYYTGMIRHRSNGMLGALHAAGFQSVGAAGAAGRLTAFKSPYLPAGLLIGLWVLYWSGTLGALAAACARKCDSAANRQEA